VSTDHSGQIRRTIAANIVRERRARDLTQRQLADALNVETMLVSRWERGAHRPSPLHEAKLAAMLFGGDIAALYREIEDPDGDDEPTRAAA